MSPQTPTSNEPADMVEMHVWSPANSEQVVSLKIEQSSKRTKGGRSHDGQKPTAVSPGSRAYANSKLVLINKREGVPFRRLAAVQAVVHEEGHTRPGE